jgi:hypothetical protein
MSRLQKITAIFFAIFISSSVQTNAADINSIDCAANYTANMTYRELIDEAARNTLQGDDYQKFIAIVNEYPTKDSGDNKEFNASQYWNFKNTLSRVEGYKFSERAQTPKGLITVGNSSSLASFDLGYALNGIVGIATYKAKQNYYDNSGSY